MPDPFYKSPEWKAIRAKAVRLSGGLCAWCKADIRGIGGARVDHIKPRKHRPDLAFQLLNLRVLCPTCDNRRHADKGKRVSRSDEHGMPLDPRHHWNRPR
jgi:5-methylcytosine-specific restriction protein A